VADVYGIDAAEGYEGIKLGVTDLLGFYDQFDGDGPTNWRPVGIEFSHRDQRTRGKLRPFDIGIHSTSELLFISDRAMAEVGEMLRASGTLFPLVSARRSIQLFSPDVVMSALDEPGSTLRRFEGTHRIMRVEAYAFRPAVSLPPVFRIPQERGGSFATEAFVDAFMAAGLKGLAFELLWNGAPVARPRPRIHTDA
jgi:hypothetical protein